MLSECRDRNKQRVLRVGGLLCGVILLSGCAGKTQKASVSADADLQVSNSMQVEARGESEPLSRLQLFVYQDDGAVAHIVKHQAPREGYFIEFSLVKESESSATQKPKTMVYRD